MNLKDILLEIGEGGTSYELNKVGEKKAGDLIKIVYEFSTENDTEYIVEFDGVLHKYAKKKKEDEYEMSVVFDIKNPDRSEESSSNPEDFFNRFLTNEGDAITVINTVVKAAKKVNENHSVRWFKFKGVSRFGETVFDNVRSRIYTKFFKKQFPNAEIEERSDYTKVIVSKYS